MESEREVTKEEFEQRLKWFERFYGTGIIRRYLDQERRKAFDYAANVAYGYGCYRKIINNDKLWSDFMAIQSAEGER